jgi:hypothetical protein
MTLQSTFVLITTIQFGDQHHTYWILIEWITCIFWYIWFVCLIVFNATFNNVSVILWWSVLLVEDPGENYRHVANHCQTLSQNVVHLALIEIYYVGLFSKLCLVWLLQNIANQVFHIFWLKIIYIFCLFSKSCNTLLY